MGLKYYIEHVDSRMVLDVKKSCAENGAKIVLFNYHGGDNQLWTYKNGMLKSELGNGLVLDVNQSKGKLCLWSGHGGSNQQWTLNDDFTITSGSGHAIDIHKGAVECGAKIIPWTRHGGANQKFRLVAKCS